MISLHVKFRHTSEPEGVDDLSLLNPKPYKTLLTPLSDMLQ